ncbi:unnamed protein product [Heligmosomoides polygyrus]|uniref:Aa_trans domain-containing protein n=1 Tax=Heligmosomoides polygyrus TaxID=6339 RepID=A0A183FI02_HELPZ|nr:unnamed protein product [Heligmosomoides polygyrus]
MLAVMVLSFSDVDIEPLPTIAQLNAGAIAGLVAETAFLSYLIFSYLILPPHVRASASRNDRAHPVKLTLAALKRSVP